MLAGFHQHHSFVDSTTTYDYTTNSLQLQPSAKKHMNRACTHRHPIKKSEQNKQTKNPKESKSINHQSISTHCTRTIGISHVIILVVCLLFHYLIYFCCQKCRYPERHRRFFRLYMDLNRMYFHKMCSNFCFLTFFSCSDHSNYVFLFNVTEWMSATACMIDWLSVCVCVHCAATNGITIISFYSQLMRRISERDFQP